MVKNNTLIFKRKGKRSVVMPTFGDDKAHDDEAAGPLHTSANAQRLRSKKMCRACRWLSFFACMTAHTLAYPQRLTDDDSLSDSKVSVVDVSKPGQAGKSFTASGLVNAPIAKVCAILQNYSGYPNFMPNVDAVKISPATDGAVFVDMVLKLPLGKIKKYRLRMEAKSAPQACQLNWGMVPMPGLSADEAIADTAGYWKLRPHPADNNKTVVNYFVYTDPGPVPLGLGWIVDSLSKDSIPKTFEGLRKMAASPSR